MHRGIFIGKIKGNPNLMMTVLEYDLIGELSYRTRIKSPLIMNLSFLYFWIVTKLLEEKNEKKKKDNIKKLIDNLPNKVLSNNNVRYVDWSFLEKVELDQIKEVLYIFIAFLAVEGQIEIKKNTNQQNNNELKFQMNEDKIEVKIPESYFSVENPEKTLKSKKNLKDTLKENHNKIKKQLDPLIDFWS